MSETRFKLRAGSGGTVSGYGAVRQTGTTEDALGQVRNILSRLATEDSTPVVEVLRQAVRWLEAAEHPDALSVAADLRELLPEEDR